MSYTMRRGAKRLRQAPEGAEKFCGYCREWWPVECFPPHPDGQGGLDNRCRACKQELYPREPAPPREQQTHCCRGHAFDEANTWYRPCGRRRCRECERQRKRQRRAAAREATVSP